MVYGSSFLFIKYHMTTFDNSIFSWEHLKKKQVVTLWTTRALHSICFIEAVQGNSQIQIHVTVRVCKGYINQWCCPSNSPTAVSSRHSPVELPFSCVWLVLLLFSPVGWVLHSLSISWASHIRRTSGVRHQEWSLWGTTPLPPPTPTPLCLSLFIFQPFPSSLPPPFSLFSLRTLLSFLVLLSSSDSINNSPDSWPSLSESDPLCLERLRYICWRAQCSSGRPSPANIPQHASQRVCN